MERHQGRFNQATLIKMCDDAEPSNPGDVQDSDWTIVDRDAQDFESTTSKQSQPVQQKQIKVPNRVSSTKKMPLTKLDDFFLW
jgi:hypothetical protein